MKIQLSEHFSCKNLLKYTLPSIIMMIFTSIYGVVDGFFVSNFVGKTPFAAVNFIMPVLMILGAIGFMFGTGGSALIAKTLGEGNKEKANRIFSLLIYASILCGIIIAALGIAFIRPVTALLGATGDMLENCVLYGRIILIALPAYILQYEFQSFFSTAGKPHIGLAVTIAAGFTNMILDALLVAVLPLGLAGAAMATAASQLAGGIIPLIYFSCKNGSILRLTGTKFDGKSILRCCINGSSELMSNISMSIVSMLYNVQLIKYAGENGVAAYGVLMYVNMIFSAAFVGYAMGTTPVIGYHYGAGNCPELKSVLKKSLTIISIFAISMLILSELLAYPLAHIFVAYDSELMALTLRAFIIFSFSFLFSGFSIFGSAFFTALNDGLTSALISFLRTLVFQVAMVIILPQILGIDGIWLSIIAAEFISAAVTAVFVLGKKNKFHYL